MSAANAAYGAAGDACCNCYVHLHCCALGHPPCPTGAPIVTRDGEVLVRGEVYGWVDRWEARKRGNTSTWRWVREGGASSPGRFKTRREAVVALVAKP